MKILSLWNSIPIMFELDHFQIMRNVFNILFPSCLIYFNCFEVPASIVISLQAMYYRWSWNVFLGKPILQSNFKYRCTCILCILMNLQHKRCYGIVSKFFSTKCCYLMLSGREQEHCVAVSTVSWWLHFYLEFQFIFYKFTIKCLKYILKKTNIISSS